MRTAASPPTPKGRTSRSGPSRASRRPTRSHAASRSCPIIRLTRLTPQLSSLGLLAFSLLASFRRPPRPAVTPRPTPRRAPTPRPQRPLQRRWQRRRRASSPASMRRVPLRTARPPVRRLVCSSTSSSTSQSPRARSSMRPSRSRMPSSRRPRRLPQGRRPPQSRRPRWGRHTLGTSPPSRRHRPPRGMPMRTPPSSPR